MQNKVDVLQDLHSVKGIPTLFAGGDVVLPNGKTDCTLPQPSSDSEVRTHHRLLMTPVGECLLNFLSQKELIGAFISVIQSMSPYLCIL